MSPKLKPFLSFLFVGLVLYFITKFILTNFSELKAHPLKFNFSSLILSFLFSCIGFFNYALIWQFITLKNKCALSLEKGVMAWFYSELGKYIPGKIFLATAKVYFYNLDGKSQRKVLFCFYLETICTFLAAGFVFLISLLFFQTKVLLDFQYYVYVLIGIFFLILHPKVIEQTINLVLVRLKKEPVHISLSYADVLMIIGFYILNFLIIGIAFFWLVHSLYPVSRENVFFLIGAFALASLMGMLGVFAPAGLGVREGILLLTLKNILPNSISGIVAILSRVWTVLVEVFLVGLIFMYSKIRKIC